MIKGGYSIEKGSGRLNFNATRILKSLPLLLTILFVRPEGFEETKPFSNIYRHPHGYSLQKTFNCIAHK